MSKDASSQPERQEDKGKKEEDIFQAYSQTCSTMFSKASKSQIEYLQAAVKLQEDMLNGCNSLLKNQLDALQKYRETGMVGNKDHVKPAVQAANNFMQSYLDWITFSYDVAIARMKFYHEMMVSINEYSPKIQDVFLKWADLFKENPLRQTRKQ
jgi:transposase